MALSFRRLLKDLGTYGGGSLLTKLSGFLTIPIYTRVFPPGEYGIVGYLATLVGVLNSIVLLGGDTAYARFFFEGEDKDDRALLSSTWIGFLALWSSVVVVGLVVFAQEISHVAFQSSEHAVLVVVALVGVPVSLTNNMLNQVFRNQFKAGIYTGTNIIGTVLNVGITIYAILGLKLGLVGLVGGPVAAQLLMLPVRTWLARDFLVLSFSPTVLWEVLKFGAPVVPTSLALWVFQSSDRVLLAKMASFEAVGLYSLAASVTIVLHHMRSALGEAWAPHAYSAYEEDAEGAARSFGRAMTYILVGFGSLAVLGTVFAREGLMILTSPSFYGAEAAIGPLALGFVAYAAAQVTILGITLKKRTHHLSTFAWGAAGVNLGLNLILIPRYGFVGAAWATMAAYTFLAVGYGWMSQRLFPIQYEVRRGLLTVALTLAFVLSVPLLPDPSLLLRLPLKIAYAGMFPLLLWMLGVIDQREIESGTRLISSIVGKWRRSRWTSAGEA